MSDALRNAIASCFVPVMDHSGTIRGYQPEINNDRIRMHGNVHTCEMGFFVGEAGWFWTYTTDAKSCVSPGHLFYLLSMDLTRNPTVRTGVSLVAFPRAKPVRKTNLAVGMSYQPPANFIPIHKGPVTVGMDVYAIGHRHNNFVTTKGKITAIEPASSRNDQIGKITCSLQVYHGYCGGPLITADGKLIGFGAAHPGAQKQVNGGPRSYRRFDAGIFDDARDLLTMQDVYVQDTPLWNGQPQLTILKARAKAGLRSAFGRFFTR